MGELRNVKLTIEYEGTRYCGWQAQADRPSVQRELELGIEQVVKHPVTVHGSGRTDRGVHALGQVANFKTARTIPAGNLLLAINTHLPEDIRVRAAAEAPPGFHARYSAFGKRYRYTVLRARVEGVLSRRFAASVRYPLDLDRMRQAAALLRGVHDFRAFEGNAKRRTPAPGTAPRSTVRTVAAVVVRECGPFVLIDAFGRGFLYGMVRTIAGTLLEVGQGKREPLAVAEVLRSRDRRRAGFNAPAHGLCLLEVYYEEEEFHRAVDQALTGGEEEGSRGREHEQILKMLV